MKKFILIITLIPSLSWAMETAKPIIEMGKKEFGLLLDNYYTAHGSFDNFSHKIDIPKSGAIFKLDTQGLGFYPIKSQIDIDKETQYITIVAQDKNFFAIKNNSEREISQLVKLIKKKAGT
jgi:hypothetical protein